MSGIWIGPTVVMDLLDQHYNALYDVRNHICKLAISIPNPDYDENREEETYTDKEYYAMR